MATLDDLLALLPDNTTGAIGADDLRTIVTELWARAGTGGQGLPYAWALGSPPGAGRLWASGWSAAATELQIAETDDSGLLVNFGILDAPGTTAKVWLSQTNGTKLEADVTGPSVDQGTWRSVPIAVTSVTGTQAPNTGAAVSLSFVIVAP